MKKIDLQSFQFLTPNDLYRHDLCRLFLLLFPPGKAGETEKKSFLRIVRYETDVPCKAVSKLLNAKATVRYEADDVSKAG